MLLAGAYLASEEQGVPYNLMLGRLGSELVSTPVALALLAGAISTTPLVWAGLLLAGAVVVCRR